MVNPLKSLRSRVHKQTFLKEHALYSFKTDSFDVIVVGLTEVGPTRVSLMSSVHIFLRPGLLSSCRGDSSFMLFGLVLVLWEES